ncbi:LysE family translocator [Allomuricauda sp. NBRC 101325]|uniref:LysE family translocator n=1 Tax=Allomuricauda sp. NBRC 101325 TaxID=1113758 RepID=UPI0024A01AB4|nr:LysE family translocator [Muricauda sp. NBRC 101325]GLU44124.1 LysE family translocator [Muricauda sp. NBRC 101325]
MNSLLFFTLESINYSILIGFVISALALAISPGPDNIFVLTQSISKGTKSGLATVMGLMSGCLVHTTLLAFGVSEIIKRSDTLFFAIKLFGALYLLYLAYMVYRSDASILLDEKKEKASSPMKLFRIGFTMNVLNPKVTIFFLAFFPGFLFSDELNTVIQFYVLGFIFILSASLVFGSIAVLAGSISTYLKQHKNTGLYLKWVQIIVFVGIALYLLLSDK